MVLADRSDPIGSLVHGLRWHRPFEHESLAIQPVDRESFMLVLL
jgi:hypothetical protein